MEERKGAIPRPERKADQVDNYLGSDSIISQLKDNPLIVIVVVLIISLGFTFWRTDSLAKDMVGKSDIEEATSTIASLQTKVDEAVNGIPAKVTEQVNAALATVTKQSDEATKKVGEIQTAVNGVAASVQAQDGKISTISSFDSRLTDMANVNAQINGAVSALTDRITATESAIKELAEKQTTTTTTTTTTGKVSTIPNVTIDVDVQDKGSPFTANSTRSEVRITLTNKGDKAITDIMLELSLYIDDAAESSAAFPRSITATYGEWSIRDMNKYEMILRGKDIRLDVGETRRIYIDLKTWGTLENLDGKRLTTYTEFTDLEVMDWNYR